MGLWHSNDRYSTGISTMLLLHPNGDGDHDVGDHVGIKCFLTFFFLRDPKTLQK